MSIQTWRGALHSGVCAAESLNSSKYFASHPSGERHIEPRYPALMRTSAIAMSVEHRGTETQSLRALELRALDASSFPSTGWKPVPLLTNSQGRARREVHSQ